MLKKLQSIIFYKSVLHSLCFSSLFKWSPSRISAAIFLTSALHVILLLRGTILLHHGPTNKLYHLQFHGSRFSSSSAIDHVYFQLRLLGNCEHFLRDTQRMVWCCCLLLPAIVWTVVWLCRAESILVGLSRVGISECKPWSCLTQAFCLYFTRFQVKYLDGLRSKPASLVLG